MPALHAYILLQLATAHEFVVAYNKTMTRPSYLLPPHFFHKMSKHCPFRVIVFFAYNTAVRERLKIMLYIQVPEVAIQIQTFYLIYYDPAGDQYNVAM